MPRRPSRRRTRGTLSTPPVTKKSTEMVASSSATWETLEAFARHGMQQLLQVDIGSGGRRAARAVSI